MFTTINIRKYCKNQQSLMMPSKQVQPLNNLELMSSIECSTITTHLSINLYFSPTHKPQAERGKTSIDLYH